MQNSIYTKDAHLTIKVRCAFSWMVLIEKADNNSISLREGRLMAMKALTQVGLEEMYKKRVTRLSGGERQRVAIARAIVKKHDIILADEPTGQLDVTTATGIMKLLIDLNKQGETLLVVTHNNEVAHMCPNRVMIRDGKLMMM